MDKELSEQSNEANRLTIPNKPSFLKVIYRKLLPYFFQFFMLFLAVTAGFFAENLREEVGEREQSREYASSMINDLVRDTMNIQYQISRLRSMQKSITDLASYVRDKQMKELKNLELYRLTLINWNPPFRWSRATIEQIKSSGSLRYFSNDSIVYYISQYDAITLHLDQDNHEDQQRYLQAGMMRSHVVDLNYTDEFALLLKSNPDSVRQTSADMNSPKQLLTNNLSEVKLMINSYLIVKGYSKGRISELSNLVHDQSRLIKLLKREFNLR